MAPSIDVGDAERGILARDRSALARAITLVESARAEDRAAAEQLAGRLVHLTGRAIRVGVTGVPGVGKSTFIEALGGKLIDEGTPIAVLAVDPSSAVTGGSILGDKTRMPRLSSSPRAFVRPSPAAGELGGVARRTREVMLVCEAFGFDVILVETVGVGQSEAVVAEMVDTFLLLALPGAGDELQGLKRGVMELVDVVAVNKADGDGAAAARRCASDLRAALAYQRPRFTSWTAQVLTMSALSGAGVAEVWASVVAHHAAIEASGELAELRRRQARRWLWTLLEEGLAGSFRSHPGVAARLPALEAEVQDGRVTAPAAARELLALFGAT